MNARHRASVRRGYTLVEIMVVVSIIGVLLAVASPNLVRQAQRARENALRSNLMIVRTAVITFMQDTGAFPNSLADLTAVTAPANGTTPGTGASLPIIAADWRGPYLAAVPIDPISNTAMTYTPATGTVRSSATGNDTGGIAFSTY